MAPEPLKVAYGKAYRPLVPFCPGSGSQALIAQIEAGIRELESKGCTYGIWLDTAQDEGKDGPRVRYRKRWMEGEKRLSVTITKAEYDDLKWRIENGRKVIRLKGLLKKQQAILERAESRLQRQVDKHKQALKKLAVKSR